MKREREEQRLLDLSMEVDRLRKLEYYEREEELVRVRRLKDAEVISQQISEREAQRKVRARSHSCRSLACPRVGPAAATLSGQRACTVAG